MFKNVLKTEFKFGERVYNFICDNDAPTNEVKEVCYQLLKYCGQIEDAIKAKEESENTPPVENQTPIEDQPPAEKVEDQPPAEKVENGDQQ